MCRRGAAVARHPRIPCVQIGTACVTTPLHLVIACNAENGSLLECRHRLRGNGTKLRFNQVGTIEQTRHRAVAVEFVRVIDLAQREIIFPRPPCHANSLRADVTNNSTEVVRQHAFVILNQTAIHRLTLCLSFLLGDGLKGKEILICVDGGGVMESRIERASNVFNHLKA